MSAKVTSSVSVSHVDGLERVHGLSVIISLNFEVIEDIISLQGECEDTIKYYAQLIVSFHSTMSKIITYDNVSWQVLTSRHQDNVRMGQECTGSLSWYVLYVTSSTAYSICCATEAPKPHLC
jgi:hypothetical protein